MKTLLLPVLLISSTLLLARDKEPFPDAAVDIPAASVQGPQTAVFAGGCFWGVQGVFERVKGVRDAISGYAGGVRKTAHYDEVSTGTTGHAESVEVTYDPNQITYGQLLKVFFEVVHDPTELNRQGPDVGTQYRSVIFYTNDDQKRVADAYIKQLDDAHTFRRAIVTQVVPLQGFFPAERHHQHFLDNNMMNDYIRYNDLPKIRALQKQLPELCKRN